MTKLCVLFVGVVIHGVVFFAFLGSLSAYHDMVGIPLAERIRDAEEKTLLESNSNLEDRIVGGSPAPLNSYPYFAGLLINLVGTTNISACGSSLLTTNRLVTAAHCWRDDTKQASQFTVVLGSNFLFSGGLRVVTNNVIVHPEWNFDNFNNDIAIIFLPSELVFNDIIHPIDLPSGSDMGSDFAGQKAIAAGFGSTTDDYEASPLLSHIVLRVITNAECLTFYVTELVPPGKLCTDGSGGIGTCHGDSGGPLAIHSNRERPILIMGPLIVFCLQIGIVSFGYNESCTQGFPSAYTRVTHYYDFIHQHL